MRLLLSYLFISLAFALSTIQAQALELASLENAIHAFQGSWYTAYKTPEGKSLVGQGFDIQAFEDSEGTATIALYWYTFDHEATNKVWFIALGTIEGDTAHLNFYEAEHYVPFNTYAVPSEQKIVGTIDLMLTNCSNMQIAWEFEENLPLNGLGIGDSGSRNLNRLTPLVKVNGKDLCSTPLEEFTGSQQAYDNLKADYDELKDDYAALEDDYSDLYWDYTSLEWDYNDLVYDYNLSQDDIYYLENLIEDLYDDIDYLEDEIDSLEWDLYYAYEDGWDDGWSIGWDDGYDVGYEDGYDDGYWDGSYYCGDTPSSTQSVGDNTVKAKQKPRKNYVERMAQKTTSKVNSTPRREAAKELTRAEKAEYFRNLSNAKKAKLKAKIDELKAALKSVEKRSRPKKEKRATTTKSRPAAR